MLWPLRLLTARLRPYNAATVAKVTIVAAVFAAFLYGDYRIFRKLFGLVGQIEALTPFFALGLISNLLSLVFLVATSVLFFSALTAAIGSFFNDLDLETYHSAPVSKGRILLSRLAKTCAQSGYLAVSFLIPMFAALGAQYSQGMRFVITATALLLLLVIGPVALASAAIMLLVRFFPVRRVHQISATLAIIVLTLSVVALRMSRPERLFQNITTDDLTRVLQTIQLPTADYFPSTWLADAVVAQAEGTAATAPVMKLALFAALSVALFFLVSWRSYFRAFVRARESSAPAAVGASLFTRFLDRATRGIEPQARALIGKEVRILSRDAAQWSQLFMMVALLFLYLYNIQMLPLEGDVRAVFVAFVNLAMSGFVVAAICLRFAFPTLSSEGRSWWILDSAPLSFRKILWTKAVTYAAPLCLVGLTLTVLGNVILDAPALVWRYTLLGTVIMTVTLVALGVGLGAASPNFKSENVVEVAMSLGGIAYMAVSMLYTFAMMLLMARPMHRFIARVIFGFQASSEGSPFLAIVTAITISAFLSVVPMELANRAMQRRRGD